VGRGCEIPYTEDMGDEFNKNLILSVFEMPFFDNLYIFIWNLRCQKLELSVIFLSLNQMRLIFFLTFLTYLFVLVLIVT